LHHFVQNKNLTSEDEYEHLIFRNIMFTLLAYRYLSPHVIGIALKCAHTLINYRYIMQPFQECLHYPTNISILQNKRHLYPFTCTRTYKFALIQNVHIWKLHKTYLIPYNNERETYKGLCMSYVISKYVHFVLRQICM
jgi:hypothetical protein